MVWYFSSGYFHWTFFYYWQFWFCWIVVVGLMFCWGQNIQSGCFHQTSIENPPWQAWLPTSTPPLSLCKKLEKGKDFFEPKNTRLASVRFCKFFQYSLFWKNVLQKKNSQISLSLSRPILGPTHIWNHRSSWTVWWRLWTPLHPISSVASSPTRPSLPVNDRPPNTAPNCTLFFNFGCILHIHSNPPPPDPPFSTLYSLLYSLLRWIFSSNETLPGPRSCWVDEN